MKRIGCCLFVVAVLCPIAHAGPEPEPSHYLELDGALGGFAPAGLGAVAGVAFGERRSEHTWLRVAVAAGYGDYLDSNDSGPFVQGRVGYEGRACADSYRIACGYVGIDLVAFYASHPGDLDNDPRDSFVGAAAVPRLGVDLGIKRFRLRLGIEGGGGIAAQLYGPGAPVVPVLALELTAGLAYLW